LPPYSEKRASESAEELTRYAEGGFVTFLLRILAFMVCPWKLLALERSTCLKALRSRPAVECLEDHTLLAYAQPLYWVGGVDGKWGTANQWKIGGKGSPSEIPENGDTLIFDKGSKHGYVSGAAVERTR